MKPVIIKVTIGIIVAMVITVGSLFAFLYEQQETEEAKTQDEWAKAYADYKVFLDFEYKMNDLLIDECYSGSYSNDGRLPESFRELAEVVKQQRTELSREAEQGISGPSGPTPESFRFTLIVLEEKYKNTEFAEDFQYQMFDCNNPNYGYFEELKNAVIELRQQNP